VLSGLDKLPPSINLWRCELQWLGGMGIIVLAVAILPLLGIGGSQIMRTETPGPMKDTKLTPRITETARAVAGLRADDARLHSGVQGRWHGLVRCRPAFVLDPELGGSPPTTRASLTSIPPGIEAVAIFFMLIGGINFGTPSSRSAG